MVGNINKNTIGETDAKIKLNALNELKNAEIKNKCLNSNQEDLLELFDGLLEKISNNNNNNNSDDNNDSNNNENDSESGNQNESKNKSKSENENDNNKNEDENYDDYEINQIND